MDRLVPTVYRDSLPPAFANPGHWCWFNAVLQALASIHDPRWWSVLKSANRPDAEASKGDTESFGQAPKDVLACLASVLLYLNGDLDDGLPQVSELAIAIQEECGISSISGEQQDAHEALVKLLEAVYVGLSKRKVAAFQRLKPWDPMRPYWLGSPNFLHFCEASEALQHFQDLFEGVLEERRLCRSCGLVRVESCPSKQAFRCLSLDLIQMNHPHFSSVNLVNLLGSSYGGKPTEEIDGLVCDRCSLEASLRRALLDSGASIFAARACHRFAALLEAHAAGARLPDMEGLEALRPVAAPPCVLKRRSHVRSFRIRVAPRIFTFHMRRLIFGPFGFIKVSNPVRYPEILNDLGLSAGYGLCSVMSHLGHATEGHFITHRVWQRGKPLVEGDGILPVLFEGKIHRWFALDASLRFLRGSRFGFPQLWHRDAPGLPRKWGLPACDRQNPAGGFHDPTNMGVNFRVKHKFEL
ncbi:unnamed protein product [Cladocopium goreaui]|uniref:Ubiquitin carboxyl-terminal hydrolase 16 (Deubiquitinating enzyme 16) (Ubiquitin thioesterase 16) (Ubiquitin-specific-processing protease 16) n=1 Tax=Cladocopium goreaui TaxID=2562237 RepID=A0A9P1FHF1_9DINO|nr:unnamed protein product [Cladocopium goreaui]